MNRPLLRGATAVFLLAPVVARAGAPLAGVAAAVAAPAAVESLRPVPQPPALVGAVRDSAGQPISHATVLLPALGRSTTTGADGRYVLRGVPAGTHHVEVMLLGYAPVHAVVTVPASGADVRLDVVMRATAIQLSSVQVTASPIGADPMDLTQSTLQLSGRDLQKTLGSSLAQTLSSEPGVTMRYAGPAANMPVIRGLTGERILVLQDGQRTGDLAAASTDHANSLDPLTAQRIEVVRGPASLLYGNNALGGVVNVISNDIPTSVPSHVDAFVSTQAESATPGVGLTAGATLPVGGSFAVNVRGGGRNMGDARLGGGATLRNSFSRSVNGLVSVAGVGERATGGLAFRGYGFDYGLPPLEGGADAGPGGPHIRGRRFEGVGQGTLNFRRSFLSYLRMQGTVQSYTHDEIEGTGAVGTTFQLATQTLDATARTRLGRLDGALGASGIFRQYAPSGDEALTPAANSSAGGVFLYQELALGRHAHDGESAPHDEALGHVGRTPKLQLGARYDLWSLASTASARFGAARTRTFDNASYSVGVALPLGGPSSVGLSASRAFRAPTVEELYADGFHAALGSYDVGAPNLRAETSQGFDAVFRTQARSVSGQLAGYWNRIDNYIAPVIEGTREEEGRLVPVARYAQADATLRGAEGELDVQVAPRTFVGAMGDVVRGRFQDGSPLPFMPAARVGGSARWDDGRLSVGGDVKHAFRQAKTPGDELRTNAYTVVNLQAAWTVLLRHSLQTITLRVDNVGDVMYRDATSRIKAFAPNPGRNLSLVYRVTF